MSRFRTASAGSSAVALAIALAAVAFAAEGGAQTGRTGPTEVVILLLAGIAVAAALLVDADSRPLYGGWALGIFALLVVLTGLSMGWSIAPDLTLQEFGRSLSYLAVFGVALLGARYAPRAAPQVLIGLLGAVVIVCAWAVFTRIIPGALAESVFVARLGAPFDYWNALGGLAALGVPACLWLAARRESSKLSANLAFPALTLLLITILLTQSRGALAAAVIATLVWLAFVPLRLRTAPVLATAALGAIPTAAWALSQDAFTRDFAPLSAREDAALPFALFLVVTLLVVSAVGWFVCQRREAVTLAPDRRLLIGRTLAGLVGVLVVAAVVAAATTGGGLGGRFDSLTSSESKVASSGAARLGSSSSSRGEYWRQAADVFKEAPLVGRGADGFSLAALPYRKDARGAAHAHGYLAQTGADLGLIGLAVVLALFAAWLVAVRRTIAIPLRRNASPVPWDADRLALTALGLAVLAYGSQALVDWTWFIPGVTVAALAAAGFLAGRGPTPERPTARQPVGRDALRIVGAAAVAVVALVCAWAVWQPQRSTNAADRAIALSDKGKTDEALREARKARDIDPYSTDPLFTRSLVLQGANDQVGAYRALEQAVAEHPRDPETWLRLAQFELMTLSLPNRAVASADAARTLDPKSPRVQTTLNAAIREVQAEQAALNPKAP